MAQTIRILPRPLPLTVLQAVPRTESPVPGSRIPLPDINMHVPNPFKRQKSNDGVFQITSGAAASGAGRVVLGDLVDGGVLLLGGEEVPVKMRVWLEGGKLTGSIWSTEFIVSHTFSTPPESSNLTGTDFHLGEQDTSNQVRYTPA